MEYKKARGPVTKSCLTCKRRHKKCDLRRPKCDRCTKGNYECAYGPPEKPLVRSTKPRPSETVPSSPTQNDGSDQSQSTPSSSSGSPELESETAAIESLWGLESVHDTFPPTSKVLVLAPKSQPIVPVLPRQNVSDIRTSHNLPRLPSDSWQMMDQIMANFDRLVVLNGFKPVERQLTQYRQTMIDRLQSSSISRRIKLISFKLYEAIATGQDWRYQDIFATWVKQFEQELCATWSDSVVPQTLQTRLTEALEISYLKAILLSNENAYPFLRFMAPTFLHTVFSDPTLWPPNHQGTSIPLAHVISSARCEMGNFIVMDTLYSMAYSLPQFVDYDTSIPSLSHELYGYSWAPGCPTELLVALAEINQCREGQPTTTGRGWKEIEFSLLTWQPQPSPQLAEWESWMIVAWLAVQESWKHTLLVYVYLALCGAASDDPRIEYSIKQLLRIVDTVKKPSGATAGLHLFAQYFIAGVCARTESQRALVKEKLTNMSESRKWLVHGNIFVPVLQHLWTGAGAGGRPVRWADYVRSREQVLPVSGASASA